jgi:hypothetical protein
MDVWMMTKHRSLAESVNGRPCRRHGPPYWGMLLRSIEDPRLFYSFGPWPSIETIAAMQAHPQATAAMATLTALCETTELGTYWVEATAGQPPVS